VFPGFNCAELGRSLFKDDGINFEFFENVQNILTALSDQTIWKKISIADDDTQCNLSFAHFENPCYGSILSPPSAPTIGAGPSWLARLAKCRNGLRFRSGCP